jgi:polysaccharide deacetylase family protein (PEP-CTERM system associated)
MLSFDVEEYFQVEAAARSGVGAAQWGSFEQRLGPPVERVLELLDEHRTSATFFVLGWVAAHEGGVVRRIAAAGHEIASHGMTHAMLQRLSPEAFRTELRDSRRLLEDVAGRRVVGYRAPTFSITHRTAWAFDVLAEAGYLYDSSVFPIRHDRYGVPDAPPWTHLAVGPRGGTVLEIPPLTMRAFGANLPLGGGGYLRLLPVRLIARALAQAQRRGRAGMIYLHPWEVDPDQPDLPIRRLARWRHRLNLARTAEKLNHLLRRFAFGPAEQFAANSGAAVEAFRYGRA